MPDSSHVIEPIEVTEQWEIFDGTPPREIVTVHATYPRIAGEQALLPDSVQQGRLLDVFIVGSTATAHPVQGPRGWQLVIPAGDHASLRIGARVERTLSGVHAFRLAWPMISAGHVPTRRLADLPHEWLLTGSDDWTCPDEGLGSVLCVSTTLHPAPMTLRLPHPKIPSWALVATFVIAVGSTWSASQLWPMIQTRDVPRENHRPRRNLARVGAAGGTLLSWVVALSLWATLHVRWSLLVVPASVIGAWMGVLCMRTHLSRRLSAFSLMTISTLCALNGGFVPVLTVTLVALTIVLLSTISRREREPVSPVTAPL